MGDTSKATEARKQQAIARREELEKQEKKDALESSIIRRYGEFLPSNTADPVGVYRLWQKSIFAELPDDVKPDDTIMYFVVSQARAAGIDARVPNQIYAIPYKNKKTGVIKWTVIIGIQGMVTIAEGTHMYGGCTKPEYEFGVDDNGNEDRSKIISCTIGVHKIIQGIPSTSFATAYFDEYNTGNNLWRPVDSKKEVSDFQDGKYVGKKEIDDPGKPKTMIAKVARAQALRATFSACAGLYVAEEMERDAIDGEIVTPDVRKLIDEATDRTQLKELLSGLPIDDKRRIAPLVSKKLKELA
jgi:RecT family